MAAKRKKAKRKVSRKKTAVRKTASKRRASPRRKKAVSSTRRRVGVNHMARLSRRNSSGKRQMTDDQEFQIMKLVLDKFLWLGFLVMGFGMYVSLSTNDLRTGGWYLLAGAALLLLFLWVIVKEFEILEGR